MKTKASDWAQLHLSAHCQCSYELTWTGTKCCCFASSDFYLININRVIRKNVSLSTQVVVLVPDMFGLFDVNEVNRSFVGDSQGSDSLEKNIFALRSSVLLSTSLTLHLSCSCSLLTRQHLRRSRLHHDLPLHQLPG